MAPAAPHRLSVSRTSAAAGLGLGILMVLCWIGAFIPFAGPTHAFIALFTPAEMHSARALAEGALWAFLFGLVSGAILAMTYNLFARLER